MLQAVEATRQDVFDEFSPDRVSMESTMKRKPDLVMALMLIFGIGVVATGYAQALAGG
jgi:Holliday junction resolvasome RuvABC endonuclease subunit